MGPGRPKSRCRIFEKFWEILSFWRSSHKRERKTDMRQITTTGHRCRRRRLVINPPHFFYNAMLQFRNWEREYNFYWLFRLLLLLVKFDTAKLPPILNALTTDNGGQKLVLEVSVSSKYFCPTGYHVAAASNMLFFLFFIATSWWECCPLHCHGR